MATAYHMEALRKQRVIDRAQEARDRMMEKQKAAHHHHHHHHHHHKRCRPTSAQGQDTQSKKNKSTRSQSATPRTIINSTSPTPPPAVQPHPPLAEQLPVFTPQESQQRSGASTAASQHSSVLQADKKSVSRGGSASGQQTGSTTTPAKTPTKSATPSQHCCTPSKNSCCSQNQGCSQSRSCCSSRQSCTTCASCTGTSCCSECVRLGVSRNSSRSRRSGDDTNTIQSAAERKADEVRRDLKKQELVLRDSNLVMGPVSVEQELCIRKMQE